MLRLRVLLRTRSQQAQGTLGEELVMANHLQHLPTPRTLEIAIVVLGTTKSFFEFDDVVASICRSGPNGKGGEIWPFRHHADRAG